MARATDEMKDDNYVAIGSEPTDEELEKAHGEAFARLEAELDLRLGDLERQLEETTVAQCKRLEVARALPAKALCERKSKQQEFEDELRQWRLDREAEMVSAQCDLGILTDLAASMLGEAAELGQLAAISHQQHRDLELGEERFHGHLKALQDYVAAQSAASEVEAVHLDICQASSCAVLPVEGTVSGSDAEQAEAQPRSPTAPGSPHDSTVGISVQRLDGTELAALRVFPSDTVQTLRGRIARIVFQAARFCIVFRGCVLPDMETMQGIGIQEDAVLLAIFHRTPQVIVGLADGKVAFLSRCTGVCERMLVAHAASVEVVRYSPCGERFLTSSKDGECKIFETDTGFCLQTLNPVGNLRSAEFSPDSRRVLLSTGAGAELLDVATGISLFEVLRPECCESDDHFHATFSPCGHRMVVVSGGGSSESSILSVHDGQSGGLLLSADCRTMNAVAWSHDAGVLLAASPRGSAMLLDAGSGVVTATMDGHVDGLLFGTSPGRRGVPAFSPDGSSVLLACRDGTARLLGHQTSSRNLLLERVFRGHAEALLSATFSYDGRVVLTASADGTAKLFDARDASCLQTFEAPPAVVLEEEAIIALLSPEADKVLTVNCPTGVLRLFDAASGKCEWTYGGGGRHVRSAAFSFAHRQGAQRRSRSSRENC